MAALCELSKGAWSAQRVRHAWMMQSRAEWNLFIGLFAARGEFFKITISYQKGHVKVAMHLLRSKRRRRRAETSRYRLYTKQGINYKRRALILPLPLVLLRVFIKMDDR